MDNLERFLDKMYENSAIDTALCINDALVLIPKEVERNIQSKYNKIEEGHVFHRPIKISDLQEVIKRMTPDENQEIYEIQHEGIGYDFVSARKELVRYKKLIGYKENDILKEENDKEYEVKKAIIPKPISQFETDVLSLRIKKIHEEVAKEEYPDYTNEASEGRLFILEDAHAGRSFIEGKEIPPFSKWRNEYFLAIPEEVNNSNNWESQINEEKVSQDKVTELVQDINRGKYSVTKEQRSKLQRAAFVGLDKEVYDQIRSQTK